MFGLTAATGCADDEPRPPISIAMLLPQQGVLSFVGASFERVARAAAANINDNGGVNGHPLVIEVYDTGASPLMAESLLMQAVDDGAVGVIGPATSGEVEAVYPLVRELAVPTITPSATAASLAVPVSDDGGFLFRNTPSDDVQALVMAYYLITAEPPIAQVHLLYEDTPYGNGLADAFEAAFTDSGGAVTGRTSFAQDVAQNGDPAAILSPVREAEPATIVAIALEQDDATLVAAWYGELDAAQVRWFFTDGARSAGFLEDLPAPAIGSEGTAPTNPIVGDAFEELAQTYESFNDDDLDEQVFAPNVWDAVHLMAAGLVVQSVAGEPFGGAGLRDAIAEVSRGPGVILHAGLWSDLLGALRSGGTVDYDGAAGPSDFDDIGETVGPYEVWRIVDLADPADPADPAGDDLTFEQILFIEAREVQTLLDKGN